MPTLPFEEGQKADAPQGSDTFVLPADFIGRPGLIASVPIRARQ